MVFLPKAVTIWEKLKEYFDKRVKSLGVQNIYLPLFIPMSYFEREKEHVE
jgi:prolyl-tRNA synthetase